MTFARAAERLPVLEAIGVTKAFHGRPALTDVTLALRPREIVGLLGPNGAGKTTTLSILATLLRPDAGRVLVCGRPAVRGRRRLRGVIGLVPQSLALYPTLGSAQNVRYFARMQGLGRREAAAACARVLADVGLAERARDATSSLSGGMQRRLNLACGIVHRPAVLLLDEPTVGVDLESRAQILRLVRRLRDEGSAVIYSTHYMEEAEQICDRVLLMDHGRLIADGTVEQLIALAGGRPRMTLTWRGALPGGWWRRLAGVHELSGADEETRATLEMASMAQVGPVLEEARAAGAVVVDFGVHSPTLADAFVSLTGRHLRDHLDA
jgi:ABC-2 type transport system ATP-binding protein